MTEEPRSALPNLVIIGSQKCGTTSLHRYLDLHPEISMSKDKELDFFAVEGSWGKGVDWYRSNFTGLARIYGEASPNYTHYPIWTGIPGRMHSVIPGAKLIFLVRDPIERLLAQYIHFVAAGQEHRPLAEALAVRQDNPYVCRSLYHLQLSQFLDFYPLSNILIINQSELKSARDRALQRVFAFLGVDEDFRSARMQFEAHRTRDKRQLSPVGRVIASMRWLQALSQWHHVGWQLEQLLLLPFSKRVAVPLLDSELRRSLVEYIKPDLDRFRALTGQTFSDWSV